MAQEHSKFKYADDDDDADLLRRFLFLYLSIPISNEIVIMQNYIHQAKQLPSLCSVYTHSYILQRKLN